MTLESLSLQRSTNECLFTCAWVNIDGVDANKVYAIACCIAYWLDSMGYGLDFKNELKSLLVSYPQVDPAAMGFPENWISEPLWR